MGNKQIKGPRTFSSPRGLEREQLISHDKTYNHQSQNDTLDSNRIKDERLTEDLPYSRVDDDDEVDHGMQPKYVLVEEKTNPQQVVKLSVTDSDKSKMSVFCVTESMSISYDADDIQMITQNWTEYQRMFDNINWKGTPNSFIQIDPQSIYFKLVLIIMKQTRDTPSKIRNKKQFINILKNIKQFETTNATFYDSHKQFIDAHLDDKYDENNDIYTSPQYDYSQSFDNLDIYKQNKKNAISPLKTYQLKQQKLWVILNTIFLLFMSGLSLPLLYSKANILENFYTANDKSQCCYCLWIGEDHSIQESYKIEWSVCVPHSKKPNNGQDLDQICHIDEKYFCGAKPTQIVNTSVSKINSDAFLDGGEFSTTSTFCFVHFHKSYPYYGYLNICIVLIYVIYLIINTFYYKMLLSVQLFIGNMILAGDLFYTYIKLYQYSVFDYDIPCPNDNGFKYTQTCYKNAIPNWMESILTIWVLFAMFCVLYPFVFYCGCRVLNTIHCCRSNRSRMETILRNLGIVGGFLFVFMGLATLIKIIIVRKADFNIMGDTIGTKVEKACIILILILNTIFAFDVFFLSHCRDRTKLMYDNAIRKKHKSYADSFGFANIND